MTDSRGLDCVFFPYISPEKWQILFRGCESVFLDSRFSLCSQIADSCSRFFLRVLICLEIRNILALSGRLRFGEQ